MIEKDTRVLYFPVKLGLNSYVHAQAVQYVKIACVPEACTYRAFQAIAIFAANVKPTRQRLVEFLDRK
jgi:uncharacterized membrane protein YgdD (TMEM256/DUF423 family)